MHKQILLTVLLSTAMVFGCKKKEEEKAPAEEPAPQAVEPATEPTPEPAAKDEATATKAAQEAPAFAAAITHKVADFDKWKAGFDAHMDARKDAGILGHHLSRGAEDPDMVTVYMPMNETEKFTAMLASDDMKKTMAEAGVEGEPTVFMMKPVEGEAIIDRDIPGMIVMFEVDSYDTFKAEFDKHAETMQKAGIIGYAINRGLENENQIAVLLQAETLGELEAFDALPEIQESMKNVIKGDYTKMMVNSMAGTMY